MAETNSSLPIPLELKPVVARMMEKTNDMFSKENVKNLIHRFNGATTHSEKKVLEFKDFRTVFTELFTDPEEESAKEILDNEFFLKRIWYCMDKTKSDEGRSLDALLNGIGLMFSGEDEDLCSFHFGVYDIYGNNQIAQEEMFQVLDSFYKTKIRLLEEQIKREETEADKLEKKQAFLAAKLELGPTKLREVIAHTFELAKLNSQGAINFPEFKEAFLAHPGLFDWDEITGDLLDAIELALDQKNQRGGEVGASPSARRQYSGATGSPSPSPATATASSNNVSVAASHPTEREMIEGNE